MNAGLDGSNAGTALRASLLALNNPAKAQEKMMENLGISMRDAEGNAVGLADMVANLTEATEHMTEADKVATLGKLVGTEAVSGFLALMKAGPTEIDKMSASLRNSGGASAEAAAKMKAGIGGALENLSGAFESLTITIGDQLVPYVQTAATALAGLAEKFTGLSDGTKKFIVVGTAMVGIFTAIVAAIGITLAIVGSAITGLGAIATAMGITTGAAGLLSAAFGVLTGPIGLTVAAIAGIVAILVLAYNKVDWFRDGVNKAWATIKAGTTTAFNAIKSVITTIMNAIVKFGGEQLAKFKAFWDENGKFISAGVKTYFGIIKGTIETVLAVIKGLFLIVFPLLAATVRYAFETIKLVVSTAINIVLGVIQTVLKVLQGDWKGAWETILKTVKDIWADVGTFLKGIDLKQTGKDIIQGLVDGIGSMGGAIVSKIKEMANLIPQWAKDILGVASPSKVMRDIGKWTGRGLVDGMDGEVKSVERMAETLAEASIANLNGTGGYSIAGYKTPSTSAGVRSASLATGGTSAKAGGVTQNVTINSAVALSPAEIARKQKQAAQQLAMEWR